MNAPANRRDYAACSGCSLCLLVCPAWRKTRDPRVSPEARAKGMQAGAAVEELAASALACTLCGACEPVCPEGIDLIGMTLGLRRALPDTPVLQAVREKMYASAAGPGAGPQAALSVQIRVLAGPGLRARPQILARVLALLKGKACEDAGDDIAPALASGMPIPDWRRDRFLAQMRTAQSVIVDDGFWMRHLRNWLPGKRFASLGESLTALDEVRFGVRKSDLYVIESRSYHADYERLVRHYDRLRIERGCAINLDLQRIAIPAAGEADWILRGRDVERIVVESMADAEAFEQHGGFPVVHLAELVDH